MKCDETKFRLNLSVVAWKAATYLGCNIYTRNTTKGRVHLESTPKTEGFHQDEVSNRDGWPPHLTFFICHPSEALMSI